MDWWEVMITLHFARFFGNTLYLCCFTSCFYLSPRRKSFDCSYSALSGTLLSQKMLVKGKKNKQTLRAKLVFQFEWATVREEGLWWEEGHCVPAVQHSWVKWTWWQVAAILLLLPHCQSICHPEWLTLLLHFSLAALSTERPGLRK